MKTSELKCVVLARVSSRTQEEEGYSLDAQERLASDYCANKQLFTNKVFRIAETASKTKERQIFGEMMKYLVNKRINRLVVEKVDRLTRSFKDMVLIDDWLEANESREVHLIKDGLVMNKHSKSQDKLNWGVKVLFAKNYTDNLREEVFKGRKEKLAQGWLPGKPPYGYKTIGDKGKKTHIPDLEKAPLVRKIFESYLSPSQSLSSVTLYAEKIGIRTDNNRPYSRSAITDNILKNPFYIGINRWQGIDYPGEQIHLIDKELFEKVQVKMRGKKPPKYRKHDPDFRGIIQCIDCGGTITWEFQKNVWYGHCNRYKGCPKKQYAKQEDVEKQLFKYFGTLLCPSPEIGDWIIKSLKVKHQENMHDYSASINAQRKEQDIKKRKLDLLYEDRLSERISSARYDELFNTISVEQEELQQNITRMVGVGQKQLLTGINVLEKSQNAAKIYQTKSASEKRTLLKELFEEIHLDGPNVSVKYNQFTQAISKRVEKHEKLDRHFRTSKNTPSNRGVQDNIDAVMKVWRARPDLNRRSPP